VTETPCSSTSWGWNAWERRWIGDIKKYIHKNIKYFVILSISVARIVLCTNGLHLSELSFLCISSTPHEVRTQLEAVAGKHFPFIESHNLADVEIKNCIWYQWICNDIKKKMLLPFFFQFFSKNRWLSYSQITNVY